MAEDGEGGGRGPRGPVAQAEPAALQGAPTPPRRLRSCAAAPGGERDLPRNRRGRSRRKAPPPRTRRGHQRRSAPPPTQTHQRARAEGLGFSRARNERKQAEQSAGRGGKRAAEGEARSAPQRASPRRARRRPAARNPDGSRRWMVGWLPARRSAPDPGQPARRSAQPPRGEQRHPGRGEQTKLAARAEAQMRRPPAGRLPMGAPFPPAQCTARGRTPERPRGRGGARSASGGRGGGRAETAATGWDVPELRTFHHRSERTSDLFC